MDKRARHLLKDFIREKLDGKIDGISTFDFKTLRGDDRFGCPGRYFDCDDTEIMRAVYVVLWEDILPELSMDTLGNAEKYRGDTMNSFHTMFGREIPDRPGFYAGLEKYHPSDEMRERVREFGNKYCSNIGNFVVLPNRYVRDTTLNFYRGTNQWRDFFDRFLVRLRNELCDCGEKDPLLEELVDTNAFCFDKFRSKNGFRILKNRLFLADYCDSDGIPEERFPLNYHWKDPADAVRYFSDADQYLRMAEEIIGRRSGRMLTELKEKLQQEGAMP